MPLQISKTNARVLERLDIQIEPATLTVVEGSDPAAPLDLTFSIPDHGKLAVSLTVEDLWELKTELGKFADRIYQSRTD